MELLTRAHMGVVEVGAAIAGLRILLAVDATDAAGGVGAAHGDAAAAGGLASGGVSLLHIPGANVRRAPSASECRAILMSEPIDALILTQALCTGAPDEFETMLLSEHRRGATIARVGVIDDDMNGGLLVRLQAAGVVVVRKPLERAVLYEALALACDRAGITLALQRRIGSLCFNARDSELCGPRGKIPLYAGEQAVLRCLVEANQHLSAQTLGEMALGRPDSHGSNLAREYVRRLRKKLADEGSRIKHIRGQGYRLEL